MRLKFLSSTAFTLVELIVYVAISSMVLMVLLSFSWSLFDTQHRVDLSSELTHNGAYVLQMLTQTIRTADAFNANLSSLDAHPSVLALDPAGDETLLTIDTYEKQVSLGDQVLTLRTLRLQEGTNPPVDLTTDQVNVAQFVLYDRTREDEPSNLAFEVTLETSAVDRGELSGQTLSFESAVSLRQTSH